MTTLIGIIFGFACIVISIFWAGADLMSYVDLPSIFIVIGGVIGATVVAFPVSSLTNLIKVIGFAFKTKEIDYLKEISFIMELATVARREGFLQLEERVEGISDPFMRKGVGLIVDASPSELMQNVLETDMSYMQERHSASHAILLQMSAFSPAFGMIGTLIGLINMLGALDDMNSLGPNMAVALITTLYGVILANLVFTPLAKKLKKSSDDEYLLKEIQLEGMLSILNGDNPRIIEDKLKSFLSTEVINAAASKKSEDDLDG